MPLISQTYHRGQWITWNKITFLLNQSFTTVWFGMFICTHMNTNFPVCVCVCDDDNAINFTLYLCNSLLLVGNFACVCRLIKGKPSPSLIWLLDNEKIDDTFYINTTTGDTENELQISPDILLELSKIYVTSSSNSDTRSHEPTFTCQAILDSTLFTSSSSSSSGGESLSSNFYSKGNSISSRVRFEPFCKLIHLCCFYSAFRSPVSSWAEKEFFSIFSTQRVTRRTF